MQYEISHRQARKWLKISIGVSPPLSDAVSAFLAMFTGGGVEIERHGVRPDESLSVAADRESVKGYLLLDSEKETAPQEKISEIEIFVDDLHLFFPDYPNPRLSLEYVLEEDWSRDWKKHFTAFQVTPRLVIKPSWEEYSSGENGEMVIDLDPGLAFGTGHHASTQLALLLLDRLYQDGPIPASVIDVGTGTGVLAMACSLLGSKKVVAVDNDIDAVVVARENVSTNRLSENIDISDNSIADLTGPYDLVVANITADVLTEMAGEFVRLLSGKGFLVLAGILRGEQEEAIEHTFRRLGFEVSGKEKKDEWVAFLMAR